MLVAALFISGEAVIRLLIFSTLFCITVHGFLIPLVCYETFDIFSTSELSHKKSKPFENNFNGGAYISLWFVYLLKAYACKTVLFITDSTDSISINSNHMMPQTSVFWWVPAV